MLEKDTSKRDNRVARVVLFACLVLVGVAKQVQAGPMITLRYAGEIEGVPATATLTFEDIRTGVNPPGFQAASPFGWVRQNPLTGWIYVEGQVRTSAASYAFTSDVVGTSAFGFGDAFRLDAFERFLIRLDFRSDRNFVYMDGFAIVPNPFDGGPSYLFALESPPTQFRRGDVNADRSVNMSDALAILSYSFQGVDIGCRDAADANDDGAVDVSDAIYLLRFNFLGSTPPPPPGPRDCGGDTIEDALDCAGAC